VRFEDVCPACEGDGTITRTRRDGIAVFPSLPGLYRYLAERDADLVDKCVVEMEGRLSGDRDLDADCGALLIHPTRLVSVRPFDEGLFESVRARATALEGTA
jgi:hypothetical protein